jgi:hypothetical protein
VTIKKIWQIEEGLYFEEINDNLFSLVYDLDETAILLERDHIGDLVDALSLINSHYKTKELAETEAEKLAIWGKAKTPVKEVDYETVY